MIALLTPTGGRLKQMELCAKFMKQQDYEGEVLWVLVVIPVTVYYIKKSFRENWTIVKVYPEPAWSTGQNTQARNLLVGIKEIKKYLEIKAVFIIEDDDYYSPRYLRIMLSKLKGYDIAGEMYTIYYNPILRGYMRNINGYHASLFQIAFVPELLPIFEMVCATRVRFIDMDFFRTLLSQKKKINLFNNMDLAIGIKGLPGRPGIGMGHKRVNNRLIADPELVKFKKFLGEDWIYYYESTRIHNRS